MRKEREGSGGVCILCHFHSEERKNSHPFRSKREKQEGCTPKMPGGNEPPRLGTLLNGTARCSCIRVSPVVRQVRRILFFCSGELFPRMGLRPNKRVNLLCTLSKTGSIPQSSLHGIHTSWSLHSRNTSRSPGRCFSNQRQWSNSGLLQSCSFASVPNATISNLGQLSAINSISH